MEKFIHYNILADYCTSRLFSCSLRPYEIKGVQISKKASLNVAVVFLPESNCWKTTVQINLQGIKDEDNSTLFEISAGWEYIVSLEHSQGMLEPEIKQFLTSSVGALAFARCRQEVATLGLSTGFGDTTLPPLMPDNLIHLLKD